jgi:DNA-binding CsgD family transcriptional regulator
VGAVGYEVLGDKITFGDHVLYVASPVRKGLAEQRGHLPHTFRPIRGAGQRRVVVDAVWVEIAVDGRQVPIGEQSADELLDKLLVMGIAVIIEPAHPSRTAPLVLCSLGLTPREAEVALLVLRGASTKAIGAELHLSAYTVKDHLKSIFDKAGVRSRRDLVAQVLTGRGPS